MGPPSEQKSTPWVLAQPPCCLTQACLQLLGSQPLACGSGTNPELPKPPDVGGEGGEESAEALLYPSNPMAILPQFCGSGR